ncbi:hypothetical protein F5Y10DRAFT_231585 [Nemania abortiva]|nr:hypothetical protein F5Y10DRAFT_231585 [Nemania abortiva]
MIVVITSLIGCVAIAYNAAIVPLPNLASIIAIPFSGRIVFAPPLGRPVPKSPYQAVVAILNGEHVVSFIQDL